MMQNMTPQQKTWHKYLIYFNMAIALLSSSNARAENSAAQSSQPADTTLNRMPEVEKDNIKIIYDERDSLSTADIAQMRQNIATTGMDIRFRNGTFTLRQDDRRADFKAEELDYETVMNKWQQEHDSLHAQPAKINVIKVSAEYYFRGAKAAYFDKADEIVVLIPTKKRKAEAIERFMLNTGGNLSYDEAADIINETIKLGRNKDFIKVITEHEKSHAEDWEKGIFKPDISLKRFIQLNALTEIKASMTEAGIALEHYKQTGDLSHFAYVNLSVDTLALQNDLRAGKGKDNPELYVAKYIFNKWLDQYNRPNTIYSHQLAICASDRGEEIMCNIQDSPEVYREYLARVQKMFANVKGLGDVTAVINPDFEFNAQLQQKTDLKLSRSFMPLMPHRSAREDLENIKALLLVIRDLDHNGKRSPETQAAVDKAIKNLLQDQTPRTYNMAQHILSAQTREK